METHDYDALNDAQCLHVDHFAEHLDLWRRRNLGEASCFKCARGDAQRRFPLEPDEVAQMDEYIATRFGAPKLPLDRVVWPVQVMVVN
jgi:hypothetical protein